MDLISLEGVEAGDEDKAATETETEEGAGRFVGVRGAEGESTDFEVVFFERIGASESESESLTINRRSFAIGISSSSSLSSEPFELG